jgi:hypothetical protein
VGLEHVPKIEDSRLVRNRPPQAQAGELAHEVSS